MMYPCKKNILSLGLVIFPIFLFAQSQPKPKKEKFLRHQVSMDAGFHYSKVFNAKRIEYDPNPCPNCTNAFVSFKPYSTIGFHFGGLYNYYFQKFPVFIQTGIQFYKHNSLNEGIKDTLLNYSNNPKLIYKYSYSKNTFEIPMMVGCQIKNLYPAFGVHFVLFQSYAYKEYYIDGSFYSYKKGFSNDYVDNHVYLELQCKIKLTVNSKAIYPYFSIQKVVKNNYDFTIGIIAPVYNKYLKK